MKKIGLTGGIGSGKSAVKKILWQLNYPCFDADSFAREILESADEAGQLATLFGRNVLTAEGAIDRKVLREIVFTDDRKRKALESFMHPRIHAKWLETIRAFEVCPHSVWVFYEAALLIETNRKSDFDRLILVTAPENQRLERLAERGLETAVAENVMNSQWNDIEKTKIADYVIQNESSLEALKLQVFNMLLWLGAEFSVSGN